jgi:hypothetical protein
MSQKYILLVGTVEDVVLQYFAQFLCNHDAYIVFVDQSALGQRIFVDEQGWHWAKMADQTARTVRHDQVAGILNRALNPQPFAHTVSWSQQQMLYHILDEHVDNVINCPKDTLSNSSKLYQKELLQAPSWSVPKSYVLGNGQWCTSSRERERGMIFKSISSIRSKVQHVSDAHSESVCEPVLFQECHQGINIRVHVVDGACFSLAIASDRVDYRYPDKENRFFPVTLSERLEQDAQVVAKRCGLRFAGIDLIYEKGRYYILEANPSPGWRYFESHMPDPLISRALMQALKGGFNSEVTV